MKSLSSVLFFFLFSLVYVGRKAHNFFTLIAWVWEFNRFQVRTKLRTNIQKTWTEHLQLNIKPSNKMTHKEWIKLSYCSQYSTFATNNTNGRENPLDNQTDAIKHTSAVEWWCTAGKNKVNAFRRFTSFQIKLESRENRDFFCIVQLCYSRKCFWSHDSKYKHWNIVQKNGCHYTAIERNSLALLNKLFKSTEIPKVVQFQSSLRIWRWIESKSLWIKCDSQMKSITNNFHEFTATVTITLFTQSNRCTHLIASQCSMFDRCNNKKKHLITLNKEKEKVLYILVTLEFLLLWKWKKDTVSHSWVKRLYLNGDKCTKADQTTLFAFCLIMSFSISSRSLFFFFWFGSSSWTIFFRKSLVFVCAVWISTK